MSVLKIRDRTSGQFIQIDTIKGEQGVQGPQGIQGIPGEDGYTPVKGVDYFTPAEVQEITDDAADAAVEEVTEHFAPVVKGNTFTATGTAAKQTLTKLDLETGQETSEEIPLPIADGNNVGFMTPEQVAAIEDLESRVGGLENQNVRLSYTASGTPTAAEIRAFVLDAGYTDTDKWASIGVVVKASNHIWRYYDNTETWTDIGLDTVQQASQSVKGIVQGSSTDGKVFVEADGTMSLNGYDALTSGISNLQSGKENVSNKTGTVSDDATKYPSAKAVYDYAKRELLWENPNTDYKMLETDVQIPNMSKYRHFIIQTLMSASTNYICNCFVFNENYTQVIYGFNGEQRNIVYCRSVLPKPASNILHFGYGGGADGSWCPPIRVYGYR